MRYRSRCLFIIAPVSTILLLIPCLSCRAEVRLNSFVVELVNQETPDRSRYTFELPFSSWIFVRLESASDTARLSLVDPDGASSDLPLQSRGAEWHEAMRFLGPGVYALMLKKGSAERLIVRRVPEILYCRYQYDPWVHAEGPYDWSYLQHAMLPHVNTVVGTVNADHEREATAWRAQGGRWIAEMQAPGLQVKAGRHEGTNVVDADAIFAALMDNSSIRTPWMEGLLLDEYTPSYQELFGPTVEAVRRVHAIKDGHTRHIDLYVANDPEKMRGLLEGSIAAGCNIVMESYLSEQPNEQTANEVIRQRLTGMLKRYEGVVENCRHNLIVCLGFMSTPPETLNNFPDVNYRVFQDMQFQHLATEPSWRDVNGVMSYTSGYTDRETMEWTARLYRHYCIEGNTLRLTNEPYHNDHLVNPDFADRLAGWDVTRAVGGDVEYRHVDGLGNLQSRYGVTGVGDDCALMTRSGVAPNRIAQTLRNLQPGREYLLRFYSTSLDRRPGDYENPRFDDVSYLRATIEGSEILENQSYDHRFRSIHTRDVMYFTYHVRRFRADQSTARLILSDWATPDVPVGNVGRCTAINFIEVQQAMDP